MYHIVAMSAVSSTSIARWGWWRASCTPTPASQPPPCPCHGGVSTIYYLLATLYLQYLPAPGYDHVHQPHHQAVAEPQHAEYLHMIDSYTVRQCCCRLLTSEAAIQRPLSQTISRARKIAPRKYPRPQQQRSVSTLFTESPATQASTLIPIELSSFHNT